MSSSKTHIGSKIRTTLTRAKAMPDMIGIYLNNKSLLINITDKCNTTQTNQYPQGILLWMSTTIQTYPTYLRFSLAIETTRQIITSLEDQSQPLTNFLELKIKIKVLETMIKSTIIQVWFLPYYMM